MSRPITGRPPLRAARRGLALLAALGLALGGCNTPATQMRGQASEETGKDRYQVQTVGEVTQVGNAAPVPIGGVGLVVGLDGTGGDCPNDSYRAMLVGDLQKKGIRNVKEVLSHPGHAMVIVEALLPAGTSKGAAIDLVVKLPPGSKATSLRGGYLMPCQLFNYDFARNLSPNYSGPRGMLLGHPIAAGEGTIQVGVGLGEADEAGRLKAGRVWGGGRSRVEQPFALVLNPDQQFARVAALVAHRVNEVFQVGPRGAPDAIVAHARDKAAIGLKVPAAYKHNLPRYLRVVRAVPLRDAADAPRKEGDDRRSYRQRLEADLHDPALTVMAALRLEALGPSSLPVLKRGLQSTHALVRFCSAEALAYLGSPSCGEELGKAVAQEPLLRSLGLTALASLDEAVSHLTLRELLHTAREDDLRYGTFVALRTLNEADPAIAGDHVNESFWLHRVAPEGEPLVHLSSTRRAEVVLFGRAPRLVPPFSIVAGEFTLSATEEDQQVNISRVRGRAGRAPETLRKLCNFTLEEVLRAIGQMGGGYNEVVTVLEQANLTRSLNSRVCCDALPPPTNVYELAVLGQPGTEGRNLLDGSDALPTTPTLYDRGVSPRQRARQAAEAQPEVPLPPVR